jgi:hypothetical protein
VASFQKKHPPAIAMPFSRREAAPKTAKIGPATGAVAGYCFTAYPAPVAMRASPFPQFFHC